ncbi:hypothetical protein QZH41_018059, partial [Actinostola sp. cb2023]
MMNTEINKGVNVTHPCDIPTNISYSDSLAAIQCSSTFTRTWTAKDNCGHVKTSVQTIKIRDTDRSNNLRVSSNSIKVALTPPPNLKVTSIVLPPSTFSGKSITVKWTVTNQGVGITGKSTWIDRLFLSKDNKWDKDDSNLGYKVHSGLLTVNQAYTESTSVNIPHAIFGDFFIIVMTDASNNVYENVGEGDNRMASQPPLKVVLTPPPDLVVSSLSMQSSQFSSGSTATILYRVTNEGLGAPYHNWWSDRVSITNLETRSKITISTPAFSGVLHAGSSYDREVRLFVAPKLKTGGYTLSIHTDIYSQVFEYKYNNNNIKEKNFTVVQTLPDLVVRRVNAYVTSDPEITYVHINFTVQNRGKGKSYGAPWIDRIYLSTSETLSSRRARYLGEATRNADLPSDASYDVISARFNIPREVSGLRYVFVVTDIYLAVLEESEANNNGHSLGIFLPRILPELVVQKIIIQGNSEIYAGSFVKLSWMVQNSGNGSTLDNSWIDQLFLSKSTSLDSAVKIGEITVRPHVLPGQVYNYTASARIPDNTYGEYFLIVNVNGYKSLKEADYTTNAASTRLIVRAKPLPNLQILTVKYKFAPSTRILQVKWKVINVRYSMSGRSVWTDSVLLSESTSKITGDGVYSFGSKDISTKLSTQQDYTAIMSVTVPRAISGTFHVHVKVNSNRSLDENVHGQDNTRYAVQPLVIEESPSLLLEIATKTKLPINITCEEPLALSFEVHNSGKVNSHVNSWTDEVFMYNKADGDFQDVKNYGSRLASKIHTGRLNVNETYIVTVNVTIQCNRGIPVVYFYVFADVHNRTEWKTAIRLEYSQGVTVVTGPLPDLQGSFINSSLQTQGGRPYKVSFNMSNTGAGSTQGFWYNALYLSEDVIRDQFDRKLISHRTNLRLEAKSFALVEVEVFIPHDIVSSDYYLLLELDSGNLVNEAIEDNNMAYVLLRIQETLRTDVLVASVSTAPTSISSGSELKVDWTLRNNGTQSASGYKCDSVYLSEDETWQIEDREIDQPTCAFISLQPYSNGNNKDTAFSLLKPLPLVPQGQYRALVKSRSNIRDPFPANNIKAGPKNINVTFPALELGSCVEADKGTSVYVVKDVPSEMTLLVTARINAVSTFQDLYLRHNQPASSYHYDGTSKYATSANQSAVVTTTKKGLYYVLLERTDLLPAPGVKSKVCAKLAKFEISRIFPTTFAALGHVTLKIEGTLFGWNMQVSLLTQSNNKTEIKAKRVYRFSSTLLYATFNIQGLSAGTKFSCKVTDQSSESQAMLNDSLTIKDGIPGKLAITVQRPSAIRLIDTGEIVVSYQNIGDTDVQSPVIIFGATEMTLIRYVQEGRPPSNYDQFVSVLAQPLEGPGGIIPPKTPGKLIFQASHLAGGGTGRSQLKIVSLIKNNEPHIFMQSKNGLRPSHLAKELWEPVWKNFLDSVGTTQKSLDERLTSVATLMSVYGRKVHLVKDLIDFQLKMANGAQNGRMLLDIVDVDDQSHSNLLILQMERIYSPLLTARRDKGIFGFGWIAPWWETTMSYKNDTIAIVYMRGEKIFRLVQPGIYEGDEHGNIKVEKDELVATAIEKDSSEIFVFDMQSKRLKAIRSLNTPNENITVSSYTSDGKPIDMKHSKGGSLSVEFNSQHLVRKIVLTKPNGEQTASLYTYESNKPLLTSTTSQDKTQSYSYTNDHDLQSVTYPNGAKLRYAFNRDTGLLDEMVGLTPDGRIAKALKFDYDWNGSLKIVNKQDNSHVTYIFDESMNILSFAGNDGIPFHTVTSVAENIAVRSLVHGDQVVEKKILNTEKGTMSVEDGNGDKVEYLIGDDGIPRNITDPRGYTYSMTYKTNKLSRSTLPDGSTETFNYDEKEILKKRTTRNGRSILFEYRDDERLAKKVVPDVGPTYYLYDSEGNIVMASNKAGTVRLRYNRDNQPISVTYPDGSHIQYRYNKVGLRVGLYENSTGYNVSYRYDNRNRLYEVYTAGPIGTKTLLKVQYDSSGNVHKRILGNNASTEQTFYPGTTRRRKLVNYSPGGNVSSIFEYKYDVKGRPVQIKYKHQQRLFKYDAASQLIGWSDVYNNGTKDSHVYDYDSRKNRIFTNGNGKRENYQTNLVNQYTSAGENEFVYDKNGNMLSRKHKHARGKDVKFVFSEENVVMQTETANERCDYIYDSLGNLYKRKCTSGETRFIVDPFSNLGGNVIAQVSGGVSTLFVHTNEQGLLARLSMNGKVIYYEFNGEGSVIGLRDDNGNIVNTYHYDPFGLVLKAKESVPNDYMFVGQWGVLREHSVPYLYRMRSRNYDALIGRFISYDPLGYRTLETNLYLYAYNNPMVLQDPQGRLPVLLIGAGIGAVRSVGGYLIEQWVRGQKPILRRCCKCCIDKSGHWCNKKSCRFSQFTCCSRSPLLGAFLSYNSLHDERAIRGAYFVAKHVFLAAVYALKQAIDGEKIKFKDMIKEMLTAAAIGWISRMIPKLILHGAVVRQSKYGKGSAGSVTGGLVNIAPNLKKTWETDTKKQDKIFKKLYDNQMDWVESLDPNDIIGPTGFGDARFIAGDSTLNYKIRFENDPNATAPAQRVFIKYKLDSDLDARSFRIGSFGFGNFTQTQESPSPLLQEKLDFVKDRNLYVRVTAGIDVVHNEATWDLQSLDPKTGEPPRDPRRGFLPPNNRTTGQGYVTFSIRAKKDVKPLTRIDAKASIIFDVNEPIDTPPIFNTIDNTGPNTNLTVLQDVLQTGSLAVMINKQDTGTGVQSVDIYYQEQQNGGRRALGAESEDFKSLLQGVTEDTAVLPLTPGRSYKLATASVDHVGNLQEIQFQRAILVDFPQIKGSCLHLNNCSNRGNCSMFNLCVCDEGFYGVDCSQDKPPLEPPLLEAFASGGTESTPIAVFLSARVVGLNVTGAASLTITIYGVPDSFTFRRGMRSENRVVLRHQEFGNMFMVPARYYSGNVTLRIVAEAVYNSQKSFTNSSLIVTIKAKANLPVLVTKDACANSTTGVIPLSINSSLADRDGSESLTLGLSGLPTGYQLTPPGKQENGVHYLKLESLSELAVRFQGKFKPFSLKVVASSVETSNNDKATRVEFINVTLCMTSECKYLDSSTGYTSLANGYPVVMEGKKSEIDNTQDQGQNNANIGAIVGGAVGGLVFLGIVVLLIVCLVKSRRKYRNLDR